MFAPGTFISILTFPGIVIHEFAHYIFCKLFHCKVYEVRFFRFGNPAGYVIHDQSSKSWQNVMISIGPFIVNTIIGIILASLVTLNGANYLDIIMDNRSILLIWLSISILMHAFPSSGDAQSLVESVLKNKRVNIFVKILTLPIIGIIYIGAFGSRFWLDLVYAILVTFFVPSIIMQYINNV